VSAFAQSAAETREAAASARDAAGFGVYVHWPFCLSKCPYCDFNSHVRARIEEGRFCAALMAELEHYAAETGARVVTSLFFGGGTPSLMAPESVAAIIARVRALWPTAADLEITLEANPTSVEAGRFAGYAAAGVNRLSLGVQALDDASLAFLGRRHSAAEALAAGGNQSELGRVGLARFFAEKLLPVAPGIARAIASGAVPLQSYETVLGDSA